MEKNPELEKYQPKEDASEESEVESNPDDNDEDSIAASDIMQRMKPQVEGLDEDEDDDSIVNFNEDEDDDEDEDEDISKPNPSEEATTEDENEEDDEDSDDEDYLQKFDENTRHNIIGDYHPEMIQHNDEEIETLCKVVRDADGVIIDPLHKTLPFLTKYEKARILGERAKQINSGAKPFVRVDKTIIDGYLIALRELEDKKVPFIVRRPLPNGSSEYWKLADLQLLD